VAVGTKSKVSPNISTNNGIVNKKVKVCSLRIAGIYDLIRDLRHRPPCETLLGGSRNTGSKNGPKDRVATLPPSQTTAVY
jgi:hypothetical protein